MTNVLVDKQVSWLAREEKQGLLKDSFIRPLDQDLDLNKPRPARDVGGTTKFRKFFRAIPESSPLKNEIIRIRQDLMEDLSRGDLIPQDRWPPEYRQLGITNLWRYPLKSAFRLIYTVISDSDGFLGSIIEVLSHKEYEKRFGY